MVHRENRSASRMRSRLWVATRARSRTRLQVIDQPAQLGLASERASLAIHGNVAATVAGVSRTPGRISRANARVFGKAR